MGFSRDVKIAKPAPPGRAGEGPFWVGVYERFTDAGLEACKVTFGSEPKDYEVYAFMLRN